MCGAQASLLVSRKGRNSPRARQDSNDSCVDSHHPPSPSLRGKPHRLISTGPPQQKSSPFPPFLRIKASCHGRKLHADAPHLPVSLSPLRFLFSLQKGLLFRLATTSYAIAAGRSLSIMNWNTSSGRRMKKVRGTVVTSEGVERRECPRIAQIIVRVFLSRPTCGNPRSKA